MVTLELAVEVDMVIGRRRYLQLIQLIGRSGLGEKGKFGDRHCKSHQFRICCCGSIPALVVSAPSEASVGVSVVFCSVVLCLIESEA